MARRRHAGSRLSGDKLIMATLIVVAVATLVAAFLDISPVLFFAALIVMILGGLLLWRTDYLIVACLLAVVFAQSVEHLVPLKVASSVDDLVVVFAIIVLPIKRVLLYRRQLRPMPGFLFFGGFAILGILSDLANNVPLDVLANGIYVPLRPLLLCWALLQVSWDESTVFRLGRFAVRILWLIVVCGGLNLLFGDAWTVEFSSNPTPQYAGWVPGLIGPFAHPSFFGQILALGTIALLACRRHLAIKHNILTALSALLAFLSFRRKTYVSLPAGVLLSVRRSKTAIFFVSALALPFVVVIALPVLDNAAAAVYQTYLADPGANARSAITLGAIDVAEKHFPLGAGFGRYGTSTAANSYSPEYVERGFYNIYGLQPEKATFATDTFWPGILGETGVLGLMLYLAGLFRLSQIFRGAVSDMRSSPMLRCLGTIGSAWLLMLIIESVAAPVFSAPPTYPAVFLIVAMIQGLKVKSKSVQEPSNDLPSATFI